MTLAIFQNDRVYEGNSRLLNAIYPMPSLSRVVSHPTMQKMPEIFAHVNPQTPPLFREDSFDPTTRIRRGRFYVPESPNIKQWPANQVNHYPYVQPILGMPLQYDMEAYAPLQPNRPSVKSIILLGGAGYATAWRIIAAERLFNGETLFMLKSTNTLGTLPDIIADALPADRREQILEGLEKVAAVAHNQMPVPIIDVCREFARVLLAAWLPTVGENLSGDLGALVDAVPVNRLGVKAAAGIINRLHPRGKSAERENQARQGRQLRDVCDEDGELSVSLVAFLLREFEWAR
jgi:hypothetical protein